MCNTRNILTILFIIIGSLIVSSSPFLYLAEAPLPSIIVATMNALIGESFIFVLIVVLARLFPARIGFMLVLSLLTFTILYVGVLFYGSRHSGSNLDDLWKTILSGYMIACTAFWVGLNSSRQRTRIIAKAETRVIEKNPESRGG